MIRRISLAVVLATLALAPAWEAQAAPPPQAPPTPALAPGAVPTLSVTSSSSRAALPGSTTAFPAVTLYNSGSKDAYCAFGNSSVVATTSSIPVRAGTSPSFWAGSATNVACISAGSDTTSVTVYQANGPLAMNLLGGGNSGGGGGGGLPAGGALGQALAKNSGSDGDASWYFVTDPHGHKIEHITTGASPVTIDPTDDEVIIDGTGGTGGNEYIVIPNYTLDANRQNVDYYGHELVITAPNDPSGAGDVPTIETPSHGSPLNWVAATQDGNQWAVFNSCGGTTPPNAPNIPLDYAGATIKLQWSLSPGSTQGAWTVNDQFYNFDACETSNNYLNFYQGLPRENGDPPFTGSITLNSGSGDAGSNVTGAYEYFHAGNGDGTASGGDEQFYAGQGGATGHGGNIDERAGNGGSTSGDGGFDSFARGGLVTSGHGNGGGASGSSGSTNDPSGYSGFASFSTGDNSAGAGVGELHISAGRQQHGGGTPWNGNIYITGTLDIGAGGDRNGQLLIYGSNSDDSPGDIALEGGYANNVGAGSDAGDVYVDTQPGRGSGANRGGDFEIALGGGVNGGRRGVVIYDNCPTSATGLPSGALWCNGNVVTRVP